MGLGPGGTGLMERLGLAVPSSDWLLIERQERGELRRQARIRHAGKTKAKVKPLAPVADAGKPKGQERQWKWEGESVGEMTMGSLWTTSQLRAKGFKLPTVGKRKGKDKKHG